ncbi:LCP family protein [Brevibacterium casei]|uniref:LCP family protein n=1 Tax=Brevibacterium casei TaxID=33889 RepID=A0A7T4DL23_9MICO|nr:LCP family protein [Brevibacterium casei]QQB15454.1 LCP family protein [Brevibacterium casei]
MVKLKTVASALGSLGGLNKARSEFDDAARKYTDDRAFPPADIRPVASEAQTIAVRITTDDATTSQGDTFAIIHVAAAGDIAAILVLNPAVQVESGLTLAALVDEGGWPVFVAIAEEVLGIRIDHIIELTATALAGVIDERGSVAVYSRSAFSAGDATFTEGTNTLDGASAMSFAAAEAVDDAGQTRTRNQRALLRALVQALRQGGLVKDPAKLTTVLGTVSAGVLTDAGLTTVELGKVANAIRQIPQDDVVTVTVPSKSERLDDGTVQVTFDAEAVPALRQALAGTDLKEFLHYLASLGY